MEIFEKCAGTIIENGDITETLISEEGKTCYIVVYGGREFVVIQSRDRKYECIAVRTE